MSEPPVEVPGFKIQRELGRGASGVVYLALELAVGREVALKVLKAGVAQSPEVRARFEREVRAAARVSHPNIVPVLATGESAGRLWYTMERIDGPSLDKVLAEAPTGRLPAARAARIVLEVARVLAAAHAAGVTHRDVKPANVVLLREPPPALESDSATRRLMASWLREPYRARNEVTVDRPRLMDFGLASDAAEARLSESGMLIGTPGYMAPEQFRGRSGEVGPAADQWALGVMLYELLTGRLPFPPDDLPTLARMVSEETPVAPSLLDPRIDRELETICLRCLEKLPRERYPSCDALVADLDSWLREEPIAARPPGPIRRLRVWARRHPRGVTALLAALIAGLGLLGNGMYDARQHRQRLERLAEDTQGAEARGAWARAETGYEEWLGLEPANAAARDGRDRVRAVQAALRAEADFERALAGVARVRETERELEELRRKAALGARAPGGLGLGLAEARGSEPWWMREPAWTARTQAERRASALVRERAETEAALGVALAAAESAAPLAGREGERVRSRLRAGVAAWHMDEWRRTERAGEADLAALHRLAVERLDPGAHAEELDGAGSLTLAACESPADAWLFRYVREGDVVPRGGPRWIPVPWPGAPAAGEPALVAPRAYAALLAARLEDEGSRPAAPDVPAPASAGADDAQYVATAEGRLRVQRYQAVRDGSVYPLDTSAAAAFRMEGHERTLRLPPGRYLLLLRAAGKADVRLPFELPRQGEVRLDPGHLPDATEIPAGFVAVTGGLVGGATGPGVTPVVGGFLAQRLELTFAEYWEFLNDPRTLREIEAARASGWRFVPRGPSGPLSLAGPDGRFEPVANPSRPLAHVSLYDLVGYPEPPSGETEPLDGQIAAVAEALAASRTIGWGYLAWRTERSQTRARALRDAAGGTIPGDVARRGPQGEPEALLFTLPSAAEWQRMAAGGQSRVFPFGDELDWAYLKGGRSRRTNAVAEPVGLFPDDESVFGVRDLTGSAAEWTGTWNEKGKTFEVRGGSWALTDPSAFRPGASRAERPRVTSPTLGVRVIVRSTESVR